MSKAEIHGPVAQHPRVLRTLPLPSLRVIDSEAPLLLIEFDEGKAGLDHDLRPLMPLRIRR